MIAAMRVLALALAIFGGVVASQLPEFAQQYRQRLGGAIDELTRVLDRFDQDAQAAGTTRAGALTQLEANGDTVARQQGAAMTDLVARLDRLKEQRQAFVEAGPVRRLGVLVSGMDPTLARSTYLDFEPAVPTTIEGATAGGIGFVGVWAALFVLARIGRRLVRRRRPAGRASAVRT